ncbi:hypothetical protein F2P79_016305 [Pimephales promelas]|nr:hypothetical protein F2P79_016305 [Pimephales promelas]
MAIKSLSPNENRLVYMANESLKRIFEKLEIMDMRLDKMEADINELKEAKEEPASKKLKRAGNNSVELLSCRTGVLQTEEDASIWKTAKVDHMSEE